jgi:hypothetical protein
VEVTLGSENPVQVAFIDLRAGKVAVQSRSGAARQGQGKPLGDVKSREIVPAFDRWMSLQFPAAIQLTKLGSSGFRVVRKSALAGILFPSQPIDTAVTGFEGDRMRGAAVRSLKNGRQRLRSLIYREMLPIRRRRRAFEKPRKNLNNPKLEMK